MKIISTKFTLCKDEGEYIKKILALSTCKD